MATATGAGIRDTYRDYCATPDDERYELINGNLMMVPAPNMKHQRVQARLQFELFGFNLKHELGKVYGPPCDVFLSDTNVVQPDLLFVSQAREDKLTDKNIQGAPDLVVEILSPSTERKDLGEKRDLYEQHGVLEYWIVDPEAETIAVHRQTNGRLKLAEAFARHETLRSAVLEGLQLKLDDIFSG